MHARRCGENCHVIPSTQGGDAPYPSPSTSGLTGARRGLRRSGLPRVTCSQRAPRDAVIHSSNAVSAAPSPGVGRTAARSARFEPEFRHESRLSPWRSLGNWADTR